MPAPMTESPTAPSADPHPGFWRVPPGVLMEVGDQLVDRQGRLQPLPLESVGRPVTGNLLVLRVERRRQLR